MATYNLCFAWCWVLVGLITGTLQGLFFHREDWLGGYGSWARRMTRLGHVAFFGTGLLNLCFGLTVLLLRVNGPILKLGSALLIIGAISMSSICYLAAWRKPMRHLFFVPVVTLTTGIGILVVSLLKSTMVEG